MDIRQLQYFLILAKQEHMSLSAELAGISQPALSKSIRNLEKELGVELFDRKGNHIYLNQNGKEFMTYASNILRELDTGIRVIRQSRYDFRGKLFITCHAFADSIIDCVSEYMSLNPKVQITLYQSERGDHDLSRTADFVLSGYGDTSAAEWTAQPLFQEEAVLLVSPRYPGYRADITTVSASELRNETFISDVLGAELPYYVDILSRMFQSAGFRPNVVFQTDDFLSKIRLVGDGVGITAVPESCVRIAKKLVSDLKSVKIRDFDSRRTVFLMRKKENQMSEAAKDFWEFARDYYQERGGKR